MKNKRCTRACTLIECGLFSRKRSQGHIEAILSFVIFLTFVIMLFIFLNPIKQQVTDYSDVDKTQEKIIENVSISFQYAPLLFDKNVPGNCFSLLNPFNLASNVLVTDSEDKIIEASNENGVLYINKSGKFYNLYFSNEFNKKTISNSCHAVSADYTFGALNNESRILYENLDLLDKTYVANYVSLKNHLKLENDFSFVVYNLSHYALLNGSLGVHKPLLREVVSRQIPLTAINKSASNVDIILQVMTW